MEDLESDFDLSEIINNKFVNYNSFCQKCSYNNDKKLDNKKLSIHYIIVKQKIFPVFIFVIFEFSNLEKDNIHFNKKLTNEDQINFNKRCRYIYKIVNFISYEKILLNETYNLVGIIYTPTYNHFTGAIINMQDDYQGLLSNNNYYYDNTQNNNMIIKLDNLEKCNLEKFPLALLYKKK